MTIGTDILGTMTNTLILALAGGSLTSFILIYAADLDFTQMFNMNLIGVEIVQAMAGSIGIVMTIPITVWLGVYLNNMSKKKTNGHHFKQLH